MKYFVYIFIGIIGLSIAGIVVGVVSFPFRTAGNMVNLAQDASDKTLTADNAIYNYEWFKRQYQEIEAAKKQLVNARVSYDSFKASAGARTEWTFEDKNEDSRLRAVVLGIENNLQSKITEYNARTSMATRNIFEDSVLPSFIDALTFIKQ
jgi:predicted transcriptional regulator